MQREPRGKEAQASTAPPSLVVGEWEEEALGAFLQFAIIYNEPVVIL